MSNTRVSGFLQDMHGLSWEQRGLSQTWLVSMLLFVLDPTGAPPQQAKPVLSGVPTASTPRVTKSTVPRTHTKQPIGKPNTSEWRIWAFLYFLQKTGMCLSTEIPISVTLMLVLSLNLCDLGYSSSMDCSPPRSSVHGIFQQQYWSGLPFPSPEGLPYPGIEPGSPTL